MIIEGYAWQLLSGMWVTLQLAFFALLFGLFIGLVGAFSQSASIILRAPINGLFFILRALPELLVLFFIYFGTTIILSTLTHHYLDIPPFMAGVLALGLLFGAYADPIFRSAFLAVEHAQIEAGKAIGLNPLQIFLHIQLPQAWRHAIPGLGNLWLILLKDTAIVSLIGVSDVMSQAKIATNSTHQPFTFYMLAAGLYLLITTVSQKCIHYFNVSAKRYLAS